MSPRMLFLALLLPCPAWAHGSYQLWVRVTAPDGSVVPTAVVRVSGDKDRHRVNTATGMWATTALSPPNGASKPLARGQALEVRAGAPGFVTASQKVQITRSHTKIAFTLAPLALPPLPCLPSGMKATPDQAAAVGLWSAKQLSVAQRPSPEQATCLRAARAIAAELTWQAVARDLRFHPSAQTRQKEDATRKTAFQAARAWQDGARAAGQDTKEAERLCQVVSDDLGPCPK